MSRTEKLSIVQLAKDANLELDEVLLRLWDDGFDEIKDYKDLLSGSRLNQAKLSLGIATKRQLTSLKYWKEHLNVEETEFKNILDELKLDVSDRAKTLPTGAIKKLRAYSSKRGSLIYVPVLPPIQPIKDSQLIPFEWRIVGRMRGVRCLKFDEILSIHTALVKDFLNQLDPIDPPGIRSNDLLESAVFRQHTSFNEAKKYPSVEMVAAALLHSLVLNHPFYNGNKRTALVAMLVLLDENGFILTCDEDELFKFTLQVAQHRVVSPNIPQNVLADAEVVSIAEWIRANSRTIEMGERPLSFRKLEQILSDLNCEFLHSHNGCNVKITRKVKESFFRKSRVLASNISVSNYGRDIQRNTISKVRADLNLTEENGIDSALFYGDVPFIIDGFIVKYRKTLQRLAKV